MAETTGERPLVTVIIPTYNRPHFFRQALESVVNQTYQNLDIMVTDNSDNEETAGLMEDYLARDSRIKYYRHKDFSANDNWEFALNYDNPQAEYVNWLMDDDVFHVRKIEIMLDCYRQNPGVSLVTSYRARINEDNQRLKDMEATKPVCQKTSRIQGESIGRLLLLRQTNFIGEPTTVLIKKSYLKGGRLGWSGKEPSVYLDFPTWLHLASQSDIIYIPEALSYFRWHEGNGQKKAENFLYSALTWGETIKYAWREKLFLTDQRLYKKAIICWLRTHANFALQVVAQSGKQDELTRKLQRLMAELTDEVFKNDTK